MRSGAGGLRLNDGRRSASIASGDGIAGTGTSSGIGITSPSSGTTSRLSMLRREGREDGAAPELDVWRDDCERVRGMPGNCIASACTSLAVVLALIPRSVRIANANAGGPPAKYTPEELDGLQRVLDEHERWLDEWVEKQKKVARNEDPVILTSEMRARARTLENALTKLRNKKVPKARKSSTTSSRTAETKSAEATGGSASSGSASSSSTQSAKDKHDEL